MSSAMIAIRAMRQTMAPVTVREDPPPLVSPDSALDSPQMDAVETRTLALVDAAQLDAAATAAIEGYGAAVFGYLRSLLDEDDARDVYGQWAEDLWKGLPGFRRESSLRAWSYRLAWHAACRLHRDPYRARGERLPSSAASRLAASVAASTIATGSRRAGLERLRAQLPPEDRTLLTLRLDRELDWDEVAAVLSADGGEVTAAALRKRFERLKDRLRELAREEGLLDGEASGAAPRRR
jgi:RNA polymerase sigma-70 factor (ECF subfamily)